MEEKNKKLTEQIETFQADFVTRNEFGKEKSNFERKIKSTIEKNIKVQKELDAERNCINCYIITLFWPVSIRSFFDTAGTLFIPFEGR